MAGGTSGRRYPTTPKDRIKGTAESRLFPALPPATHLQRSEVGMPAATVINSQVVYAKKLLSSPPSQIMFPRRQQYLARP